MTENNKLFCKEFAELITHMESGKPIKLEKKYPIDKMKLQLKAKDIASIMEIDYLDFIVKSEEFIKLSIHSKAPHSNILMEITFKKGHSLIKHNATMFILGDDKTELALELP
jgi:hypothetical protein